MVAPSEPITFYDSGSCPYAQRAWITLVEKKLPFETVIVDLQNKPDHFKELYATIHPDSNAPAKVPIIIDGPTKLIESSIIAEYLDEKYPDSGTKIFPADPADKAKVRLFVEQFTEKWSIFKILRAPNKAALAEAKDGFVEGLKILDKFLTIHGNEDGGSFFLGARYSFAETATSGFVKRGLLALPKFRGVDPLAIIQENKLERLGRWIEASLSRDSLKSTLPPDEKLVSGWERFVVPLEDA